MINTTATLPAATWRDYLTLTKPKVISLLLFTAICPMFMAARGLPHWLPLLGVLVGGYMATGGAGVFNMVLDRDIDGKMRRTANRPLVTGVISVRNAVLFGLLLSVGAFLILWQTANLLTALLAWFGLLFYVIVYTAWLKRSTWQNIVIGGVAGSVMPLLGWAAVTNGLDWMAVLLFVLIFMWTPVHFWALAFLVKDQYEAVGIPMAPAVLGSKRTLQQMMLYAVLTILASLAPLALNEAGWLYTGVVLLLDIFLMHKVVNLYRHVEAGHEVNREEALSLYKYSMLYLALVFLTLVADRTLTLTFPI
ncbi:MAG: heme o synthase [Caldilineaceae bacterium]|nr:heme o synthase [Caldilineaceae bacterium]